MRLELEGLLDNTRARVAKLIGAETDEVVFVPNATHGVNTVLRNFEWHEGDVLIDSECHFILWTHVLCRTC